MTKNCVDELSLGGLLVTQFKGIITLQYISSSLSYVSNESSIHCLL